MYLNESDEYKEETALLIQEFLNQRILGMKNEVGVYITPAFPKLIYVLEDDNITEDSDYWYLTELAAKCTAKRMVPDYVSEKVMKSLKIDKNGNGQCYPLMGCVDGKSVIDYKINDVRYVESFERAWDRLSSIYDIDNLNGSEYINTDKVSIYDHVKNNYVNVERFIRNTQYEWIDISFTNGRHIKVTDDHVFEVDDVGEVYAKDLKKGDAIKRLIVNPAMIKGLIDNDTDIKFDTTSWFDALVLSNGYYDKEFKLLLNSDNTDIVSAAINYITDNYHNAKIKTCEVYKNDEKYKEISIGYSKELLLKYADMFEGSNKSNRHIPNHIFNSNYDVKMSFLAGLVDCGHTYSIYYDKAVQLECKSEELAMQEMLLAIDLGMNAITYKYNKNDKTYYRVEFMCSRELCKCLVSKHNYGKFDKKRYMINNVKMNAKICSVKNTKCSLEKAYSYDVTCDSHHFTVNGLWSHNCRSALTPYLDENGNPKYYGRSTFGPSLNLVNV